MNDQASFKQYILNFTILKYICSELHNLKM